MNMERNLATVLEGYKGIVPVPVVDIAKDLGIEVFLTKRFKDAKSGEITKEDGTYKIYLNANHPYTRNRFTLAHEIAHYKFDRDFLDQEEEIEDFAGKTFTIPSLERTKTEHDERELKADQFAAELLMPEDEFVRIWEQKATIQEVASFFEVSEHAAEVRARVIQEKRLREGSEEPVQA
jgi:Zn-dependent peptidase ImmA (M78 family)